MTAHEEVYWLLASNSYCVDLYSILRIANNFPLMISSLITSVSLTVSRGKHASSVYMAYDKTSLDQTR
jgi:hypothetical protein